VQTGPQGARAIDYACLSTRIARLVILLCAIMCAGCANTKSANRIVEVAVTAPDGQALSPRQLQLVLASLTPQLLSQGIQIADGRDQAREILFVQFTPDALSKDGGHISILGIQQKPRKAFSAEPLPTAADRVIRESGP
jgi:hypothetical protein